MFKNFILLFWSSREVDEDDDLKENFNKMQIWFASILNGNQILEEKRK